jgi:hypothetical protein
MAPRPSISSGPSTTHPHSYMRLPAVSDELLIRRDDDDGCAGAELGNIGRRAARGRDADNGLGIAVDG